MATGVLTVAVGRATRFLQYLTSEKEYKGVIRLGITTDTDDITGKIRTQDPVSWVKEKAVHISLQRFIGRIDQFPPRVSAIKKDGVRCYKLVRAEKDFEIAPRRVQIEQIDVQKFVEGNYPEVTIRVVCGGGTYIRSIARECGEALVVPLERVDSTCNLRNRTGDFCAGGTLAELVRTRSGIFTITNSLNLDEIRVQVEEDTPLFSRLKACFSIFHFSNCLVKRPSVGYMAVS
ncbi:unnamed protein product [Peronospora belbahrii]|uniref:tRNA pseudouridine(55) synthase n=1 Tax=Peronospora belbahrii TaxID=622444 RepID=A0ABN8D269_9STRA|nr:unnamed protein product [Peronospora belbahrii]